MWNRPTFVLAFSLWQLGWKGGRWLAQAVFRRGLVAHGSGQNRNQNDRPVTTQQGNGIAWARPLRVVSFGVRRKNTRIFFALCLGAPFGSAC